MTQRERITEAEQARLRAIVAADEQYRLIMARNTRDDRNARALAIVYAVCGLAALAALLYIAVSR
jgi:hypothetical protein